MRARSLPPALVLIAASSASLAAPATPEGAKAIEDGYAAYFGRAVVDKGVVSVTPEGDAYVVAWDLQTALNLAGVSKGALRADRFSYTLAPGGGDSWVAKADRFPRVAFDAPTDKGRMSGVIDVAGFRLEMVYDPSQANFLRSHVSVDLLAGKVHDAEADHETEVDFAESGISVETRAKASEGGAGVDVAVANSVNSLSETIVAPAANGQAATKMSYGVGATAGGVTIAGLRAREIGDFWKFFVAHVEDVEAPPDWKQRLGATLPLWNDLRANAETREMTLQTSTGEATLKTLGETLDLSGFTADGVAEIGVKIDRLAATSSLLPPWAASLSPLSFNFDLRIVGKGLDQAARLALDDPNFGLNGDLSPETEDKIDEILLAGRPKVTLAPGRLTTPTIDLAFEGEVSLEASAPNGRFTFTADSLDKTIALLGEIVKSEPDMQPALLGVVYLKGLATTGPDGRLTWKVEVSQAGVSVNGAPLSPDK